VERLPELAVLSHAAVPIATNSHRVTVMDETLDERGRHHVITEDVAQSSKTLLDVSTVDVLVAARNQL
jgi:hypothetical protein